MVHVSVAAERMLVFAAWMGTLLLRSEEPKPQLLLKLTERNRGATAYIPSLDILRSFGSQTLVACTT